MTYPWELPVQRRTVPYDEDYMAERAALHREVKVHLALKRREIFLRNYAAGLKRKAIERRAQKQVIALGGTERAFILENRAERRRGQVRLAVAAHRARKKAERNVVSP